MKSLLAILAVLALAACAGTNASNNGALPGRTVLPQQAHAIPIETPAPSSFACPAHHRVRANCSTRERSDLHPLTDSGALAPDAIPGYHPRDVQAAYTLGDRGGTVAIVVPYGYDAAESDLAVYRSKFGLPACTTRNGCLRIVAAPAPGARSAQAAWSAETALDLDVVSAACPACSIALVRAGSDRLTDLLTALRAATVLRPTAISVSWAIPESGLSTAPVWTHDGIPVVAGTGDGGYGVAWPSTDPTVIAAGGTTLQRDGAAQRGFRESGWSDAGYGCSALFAAPRWQASPCGGRAVADVSADADPATGVAVYDSQPTGHGRWAATGGWAVYGGTSVAAPIVAAAVAQSSEAPRLSTPQFLYAHPELLNAVSPGGSPLQSGLGSPNGANGL